ncbi:MAG TPA: hypothetical protein VEB21_07665 [Terriglobales bacterium]|nr:hypothetical protein [Terriglobales bacterium]
MFLPTALSCRAVLVLVSLAMAGEALAFECGGNVTATVRNGRVRITGDDAANCIQLAHSDNDLLWLEALDDRTAINGQYDPILLLPVAETKSVQVNLRKGNDRIEISNVDNAAMRWFVRGGDGDDFLGFGKVTLDRLLLSGGKGNDTLVVSGITAQRANVSGAAGRQDSSILADNDAGRLAIRSVEISGDPLTCPMAEQTVDGAALIDLSEREVVECQVKKNLTGSEGTLVASITAISTETGEEFLYWLSFKTAAGMTSRFDRSMRVGASISNESADTETIYAGEYFDTPSYWMGGFHQCHELFVQTCPDHLNRYSSSGVMDIGPGISSDDGLPI